MFHKHVLLCSCLNCASWGGGGEGDLQLLNVFFQTFSSELFI